MDKYPLFTEYLQGLDKFPFEAKQKQIFCHGTFQAKEGIGQKIPYDPRTKKLINESNFHDTDVYGTFDEIVKLLHPHMMDSECLSVATLKGICAITMEQCIDENGEMSEVSKSIMDKMKSYMEVSEDGAGITIFFTLPDAFQFDEGKYSLCNPEIGLTVYIEGHKEGCINLSGNPVIEAGIEIRGAEMQEIMDRYLAKGATPVAIQTAAVGTAPPQAPFGQGKPCMDDFELMLKAGSSKSGDKIKALMDGDASAYGGDMAKARSGLLCHLAFWSNKDAAQMDRIFRSSKLFSQAWDSPSTGNPNVTIGEAEIQSAIQFTKSTYSPKKRFGRSADELIVHSENGGVTLSNLRPESCVKRDDIGISQLFADTYKKECRYVKERKKWYIFSGKVWEENDIGAMELAKEFAGALLLYAYSLPAANEEEESLRMSYIQYTRGLQSRKARETLLKDASSVHPIRMDEFDKDPYTLNCENCTLDLRNMKAHCHNADDLLTKMAGVNYDPRSQCSRWEEHMDQVTAGDTELIKFMQKSFGYSLTADTKYECFFILYGPTSRNGKGTTMETINTLLGDYGKTAMPETLAKKSSPNGSGPSEDIARLAGARLVNFSEPSGTMVLSASLVKTLTGNDTIAVRFLHENSFEYRPAYKIFINTNHLPRTNDLTVFSSGRVKVLPFNQRFVGGSQNQHLKEELRQPGSLSGILNWCIEGLRLLEAEGFDEPDSVREATSDYAKASDKIGRFIEDCLEENPYGEILTDEAYTVYSSWCRANGQFPEQRTSFNQALESHGVTVKKKRPRNNLGRNPLSMILGYSWQAGKEPASVPVSGE